MLMERWQGKVAVVTGASAGIGAGIAECLVKKGLKVVGIARRVEKVEELLAKLAHEKGKLYAVKADISKPDEVIAAFQWIKKNVGPVHILINNAGVVQQTTLIDGNIEKWKKILDLNVLGLCVATREAVASMKENKIDGHIIHINSVLGHSIPPHSGEVNVYPASKYAVTALTETLRIELKNCRSKIKVTSISPGRVITEMLQANFILDSKTEEYLDNSPSLKVEDVVDSVNYVLSTPPHVQIHELTLRAVGDFI